MVLHQRTEKSLFPPGDQESVLAVITVSCCHCNILTSKESGANGVAF